MKRCPECRRDYYDDTLSYCLDDGTALVDGPATPESSTAILPRVVGTNDESTAVFRKPTQTGIESPNTSGPSAEFLLDRFKAHKAAYVLGLLILTVSIGAAGYAFYKFAWPSTAVVQAVPFQSMKIERLTANGKATDAVISADGKQVVYVVDDGGRRSLWLRQVATATDVQLAAPDNIFYWSLTISPDGNFLYYIYGGASIRSRVLYKMPLLGGIPAKVVEDVGSPVGFSPDGKQIAFVRVRDKESVMMIANADGSNEREIAKRPGTQSFGSHFSGGVAWSADGTKILSVANKREGEGRFQSVVEVSIADGTQDYITSRVWYEIQRLALLPDGSGLLITAADKPADFRARQLWHIPYPTGDPRKITNDLTHYTSISLSSDSSALITVQEDNTASIWVAPDGDAGRALELRSVSGKLDGYDGVAWTPDGKILYTSMASGTEAIWVMDVDGKNRRNLTVGENPNFWPSVSTDGRYITFTSEQGRNRRAWMMGVDGNNPREIFPGNNPVGAGEWIIYGHEGGLKKAPVNGGDHMPVGETMLRLNRCAVSPDGKNLACQTNNIGEESKLAVFAIEAVSAAKVFDVKFELPARIKWAPDGHSVTYVSREAGIRDIWSQPIDGSAPKRITNFNADQIFAFDWSRDNKLVISYGTSTSDVVLIRNSKK